MDENQLIGLLMGFSIILVALLMRRFLKENEYLDRSRSNMYFYSLIAVGVFIIALIIYDRFIK